MALIGAEKTKTFFFFVISQAFLILSLYAVYDEVVVRRPWKHFQNEFNRLEMQVAMAQYNKVYETYLKEETPQKIKKLRYQLEEAMIDKESDKYKKLAADFKKIQIRYDDLELKIKFNKSILDAYYYEWKHAYQSGHPYQDAQAKYANLEKKIQKDKKELKTLGAVRDALKEKLATYDDRILQIKDKIAQLKKPLKDAQKEVDKVAYRIPEIKQIVIKDLGIQGNINWGKVDRCQTCHVAVDKAGYEDVVKAFHLTVVKDKEALREALKKHPDQKGLIITEAQREHYQIMYGTHPRRKELFGAHPVADFGCTSCHGGDGRALNIRGIEFGGLSGKKEKQAQKAEEWGSRSAYVKGVFGEYDFAHATNHYGIEPLLRGINKESNCLACHRGQIYVPGGKMITKGLNLFVDLGCHGCHLVKGYEKLYKVGPDLKKVASKVDKTWLVDWIKNPKEYMPNSRMPMFGLTDKDVVAVASFLIAMSEPYEPKVANIPKGDPRSGERLFNTIGCLGCHSADSSEKTYAVRSRAPNLSRLASKVKSSAWVYDWLKDPKNYSRHARMPSLRLTDQEASDITAYLMSLNKGYAQVIKNRSSKLAQMVNPEDSALVQRGKAIIRKRGCYGCHDIKGFETAERIGPELSGVALKEIIELDFGDALKDDFVFMDVFGERVYVGHNSEYPGISAADAVKDVKIPAFKKAQTATNLVETWQSWVRNKLAYPMSIYRHKRSELLMPNFKLSDEELDGLVAFLKALQKKEVPLRFDAAKSGYMPQVIAGQKLISQYNCLGCHSMWDYGGEILPDIDKQMGARLTQFYPPSLDHVGIKIRPEWLFNFLKEPFVYRPQVTVRMPTFGFTDEQTDALVDFFAGVNKVDVKLTKAEYVLSHKNLAVANILGGPEAYNCFSCHFLHGKAPGDDPANWAPDWALMTDRLQPEFITKWIKNPVAYQKYAVMPAFLNSDDEAHPDYLDGKAEKHLEVLKDYVLSGGKQVGKE